MEYYVYPADKKGTCIKGFCPTVCRTMGIAVSTAYQLHKDLRKYHYDYHEIIISEVK